MSTQVAIDEYAQALRQGQKEYRELLMAGKDPHPAVLDEILPEISGDAVLDLGLVDIPTHRIIGTKSAGRITAFTATFKPLLDAKSEFGSKWISLCAAHLGETGISDPIQVYEYLGNFYVQEGNKRVSVLRYFGATRIPGEVYRITIPASDNPRVKAYHEFLEFYQNSHVYTVQFTTPGKFAKLCKAIGMAPNQEWTNEDRRRFHAYFGYFRDAYRSLGGDSLNLLPEDALLLWLELYTYAELGQMSTAELKKSLSEMWPNILAIDMPDPVVSTEPPPDGKSNIITKMIRPDHVNVAFIHHRTPAASAWTQSHETGRRYLEEALGKAVTTRAYLNANTPEQAEELLEQAIADGANVVFTTTPQLIAPSLKISVKYPKVRVFNCSVHMPYSTVKTYYSRIYEGKFITGAIAGTMAENNRIGYVGSYPILGVPASINAFALGAQMTNPRAVIELKWSCVKGNPTREFLDSGIRVISNRDTPVEGQLFLEYGTYIADKNGKLTSLGSPVWVWGKYYENVVRSILNGGMDNPKPSQAINYWWGMNSGVIDVTLSDTLPDGVRALANTLRKDLRAGTLDPFRRPITAQDGTVKNDGTKIFSPEDVLYMDWLCANVRGSFPTGQEILPYSRSMVKLLGIFPEDDGDKGVL